SYAKDDRKWAETVCGQLEEHGIGCWIAPRDIAPGVTWPAAITEAIRNCRAMIVVFSDHANKSPHMAREVEVADSRHVPILPVRVENIEPSGDLEYFLGNRQWFDLQEGKVGRKSGLADVVAPLLSEGGMSVAPAVSPPAKGRKRRAWGVVAAGGLLAIAAVAYIAWPRTAATVPQTTTLAPAPTMASAPAPAAT